MCKVICVPKQSEDMNTCEKISRKPAFMAAVIFIRVFIFTVYDF